MHVALGNYLCTSNCISSAQVCIRNWPRFFFFFMVSPPAQHQHLMLTQDAMKDSDTFWNYHYFFYFFSCRNDVCGIRSLGSLSLGFVGVSRTDPPSLMSNTGISNWSGGPVRKLHKLVLSNRTKMFRWFRHWEKNLTSKFRDELFLLFPRNP